MSLKMFVTFGILALCHMAITAPLDGVKSNSARGYSTVSLEGDAPMPQYHNLTREYLRTLPLVEVPPSLPAHLQPRELRDTAVGGYDERVVLDNQEYPYSAMGRLDVLSEVPFNQTNVCSGSLVGPRHVMVARHCVKSDNLQAVRKAKFSPSHFNGTRLGESYVTDAIMPDRIIGGIFCYEANDWAVLILADRLGDKLGYLGVKAVDCETQANKPMFSHVGYPQDKGWGVPTLQAESISIKECHTCTIGSVRTDADGTIGQSGGPLFIVEDGLPWLYGVSSTHYLTNNGFATGPELVKAVTLARKEYP
ncbi:trypsin-like cysteine/serine peptidase domain-containing protein [Fusarium tricinctum]|uniref:Trypsin-like cysteine/serine peptidase domain-containing protein n=1 Tax=Fusarium tricinctum TaxID=61284 RepID=A0A8K0SCQ8_9HYPO|nr:trypsin-like cysteine/serine peptidase domain-containing protein [Fusarium tricinctum]